DSVSSGSSSSGSSAIVTVTVVPRATALPGSADCWKTRFGSSAPVSCVVNSILRPNSTLVNVARASSSLIPPTYGTSTSPNDNYDIEFQLITGQRSASFVLGHSTHIWHFNLTRRDLQGHGPAVRDGRAEGRVRVHEPVPRNGR